MIWAFLEALSDPTGWAIRIDKDGVIHLQEIAVLHSQGARVR